MMIEPCNHTKPTFGCSSCIAASKPVDPKQKILERMSRLSEACAELEGLCNAISEEITVVHDMVDENLRVSDER